MTKKQWMILGLVALAFATLLGVGIAQGDVWYVLKNAKSFCFS